MSIQQRAVSKSFHRKGTYFFTLCTADRKPLFGTVENGLSGPYWRPHAAGTAVAAMLERIGRTRRDIELTDFVVMPNHIHLIVTLKNGDSRTIGWFVTYCRGILEKQTAIDLVISAKDSLVEELHTDLAFRTARLSLELHHQYWQYDRLYVPETPTSYGK